MIIYSHHYAKNVQLLHMEYICLHKGILLLQYPKLWNVVIVIRKPTRLSNLVSNNLNQENLMENLNIGDIHHFKKNTIISLFLKL